MTMPTLVNVYQKKKTVNQLKKSYTMLYNAIKLSEVKNGSVDYWNYTLGAKMFFETYLSEYISVSKKTVSQSRIQYMYLSGSPCKATLCTGDSYLVFLSDGSSLMVSNHGGLNNGKVVSLDINGYSKPNTVGKDLFSYVIRPKYGLAPFGYKGFGYIASEAEEEHGGFNNQVFGEYNRDVIKGQRNYACNRNKFGFWCSALILIDGWQIKEDYPW